MYNVVYVSMNTGLRKFEQYQKFEYSRYSGNNEYLGE